MVYGYYGFQYFNGKFYFGGNNGTSGEELWATDGTENGTYLVKEIRGEDSNGNNYGSNPNGFTVIGDTMYFIANDGEYGSEPWMTDGTANGTRMLKDIREEDSDGNNYGSSMGVILSAIAPSSHIINLETKYFSELTMVYTVKNYG